MPKLTVEQELKWYRSRVLRDAEERGRLLMKLEDMTALAGYRRRELEDLYKRLEL